MEQKKYKIKSKQLMDLHDINNNYINYIGYNNNYIVYIEEHNKYIYINKINLLSQKLETIDSIERGTSIINICTPYFNEKYNILIFNQTFLEYSEVIDSIKQKDYFQPNDIIYLDLSNNKPKINNIIYQKEDTFYNILDCTDKYLFILSINKYNESKIIKYKKNYINLLINNIKEKINSNKNIKINKFDKIVEILDNNNIIFIKVKQEDIKNYSHFILEENRILFDILYIKKIDYYEIIKNY